MQCAARSIPAQRSFPARLESISLEPTPSVEAARKRRSSSGNKPAKWPKPSAPVDSTAARRRSTTESAVASETPAAAYVRLSPVKGSSLRGVHDEVGDRLGVDLLEVLRLAGHVARRVALAGVLHRALVPGDPSFQRDLAVAAKEDRQVPEIAQVGVEQEDAVGDERARRR